MLYSQLCKPINKETGEGGYVCVPFWLLARPDIEAAHKLVYAAILNRLGNNEEAWPSQATIAKELGRCEDAIKDSIRILEQAGLLTIRKVGAHNRYTLKGGADYTQEVELTTSKLLH